MVALELSDVEIDYCPSCGGVWLDSGELEILMGDTDEQPDMVKSLEPIVDCSERPVRCPICTRKMTKVYPREDNNIILDKCPNGDGIWLNKGELESVLTLSRHKNDTIINLLKDIFNKKN